MASIPAQNPLPQDHPLQDDSQRLENILDLMWAKIQKTIQKDRQTRRRRNNSDLTLVGGISAEDVLYKALEALLRYDPRDLQTTWEALAVGIARNKAVQAVRDKTRGRRSAGVDEIDLVPFDAVDSDGTPYPLQIPDPSPSPEEEAASLAQELVYRRVAEEVLSARDRDIFFRRHYLGESCEVISRDHDITGQRVGQIYMEAARKIHATANRQPDLQ